ncbi:MAG: flippase [Planctomycetes bacterium]|nr:flippase [Planctomycetota bacterium]
MTESGSLGAKISGASLWMAAAQIASLAGAFAVITVASRRLGDAQYGILATVTVFVALGSILLLGLPQAMVREAASSEGVGARGRTIETLGSGQAVLLVAAGIVALALCAAAPWASALVDAPPGAESSIGWSVRIAAGIVMLIALAAGPDAALQGLQAFRALALRNMTATLIGTGATLTALRADAGLTTVMAMTAVAPAVTVALSVRAVRRLGVPAFPLAHASRVAATRLLRFGLPLFINEATYVIHTRVDSLLLLVLWSHDARFVGFYNAALYVAVTALVPPRLLMRAFFPAVAQLTACARFDLVASGVRRATGYLVILVLPIVVGGALLGEPILVALFKPAFAVAAPTLVLLLVGYGANALTYPFTAALLGMGQPRAVTWNTVPTAVAILAMHLWLIPIHGMTGAAVGASVPIVVGLLVYPWQTALALRTGGHAVHARGLVPWRALAKSAAAAAAMAAAVAALPRPDSIPTLVMVVAAGAVVYALAFVVVLRGVEENDRRLIGELWSRRKSR